jgi:hypothetical protein
VRKTAEVSAFVYSSCGRCQAESGQISSDRGRELIAEKEIVDRRAAETEGRKA